MDLDLRPLHYFVVLAEELHFGRAARRLHITQPPLSKAIRRLESEMRLRLFERTSKQVSLTPSGALLLPRARNALRHAASMAEFAGSVAQGRTGRIELGFTALMLFRGLGRVMRHFSARHADVEVNFTELPSQRQIERVKNGDLDAGFINSPLAPVGLEVLCVCRERYVACVPASHPLARARSISLNALRDERLLVFSRDSSHAFHDRVMAMYAAAGVEPDMRQFSGQVLTLVSMVAAGFGVTVVPECAKRVGVRGVAFPAIGGVKSSPTSYFIWNRARTTPALLAFIDVAQKTLGLSTS